MINTPRTTVFTSEGELHWPNVVLLVINILLLIMNLIGNTLVCLVILMNKRLRVTRDILLLNLACADIAVGIFFSPLQILSNAYTHPPGQTATLLCKFVTSGSLGWLTSSASIFTLTVLAVERFFAVNRPFSVRGRLTGKRVRHIVTVCWMYAFFLNLPLFIVLDFDKEKRACFENWPSTVSARVYSTIWFLLQFFIPVTLMVVLYGCVVHKLWFSKDHEHQLYMMRARKRVTKIVVTVTVVYLICWSPETTLYMFLGADWNTVTLLYAIFETLVVLNSSINPVIYSLCSQRFRDHIKKTMRCCSRTHGFNITVHFTKKRPGL